jgi:hypothetical protein
VLFEIESVEARDRYFPHEGEESEEFTRFVGQHAEVAAAWQQSSTFEAADLAADYLVLGE